RGEQGALLQSKPLPIGGRSRAAAPHRAQRKLMVVIHKHGVGGMEGIFAQKPTANMLQHVHRNSLGTLPHGCDPEIGAMGNQQRCKTTAVSPVLTSTRTQIVLLNAMARHTYTLAGGVKVGGQPASRVRKPGRL